MSAEPSTGLFTRGGADASDNRGRSMVQIHASRLQKKKENEAKDRLRALFPKLGEPTVDLVLRECQWDTDRSLALLRQFMVANSKELAAIAQIRAEHESRKAAVGGRDTGSPSGEPPGRHERSRKKPSRSKHKKDDKETKGRKRKHRGRESLNGETLKGVIRSGYGSHGILREADLDGKRPEFMIWASEVKRIEIEVLPRNEEKELFKEYMEDYNTSTFPHRKYYDIAQYEREKTTRAKGPEGEKDDEQERTAFDDERELQRSLAAERAERQRDRLKQAYRELQVTDKASDMRAQDLLRAQMTLAYRTGDVAEAHKLAARLAPDDIK